MVAVAALMFAALFAYVAGSPFVLQQAYGLSPSAYGVVFAVNAVGLIIFSQLNPVLVARLGPEKVLTGAVIIGLSASGGMAVTPALGLGLIGFIVPVWLLLAACGLAAPNAAALALSRHGEAAGTASALLGSAQFVAGGLTSPLVGALNNGTAVPLAAIVTFTTALAAVLLIPAKRHQRRLLERELAMPAADLPRSHPSA